MLVRLYETESGGWEWAATRVGASGPDEFLHDSGEAADFETAARIAENAADGF